MKNACRTVEVAGMVALAIALASPFAMAAQDGVTGPTAPVIDTMAAPPPFPSEAFVPPDWAPLPDDLDIVIIRQDEIAGQFRILDVTLNREITEEEIVVLANLLKDSSEMPYQRTYIVYYLPGMPPGQGGWATSHFLPDLEVGFVDQDAELQQSTPGSLPGGRF